MKYIGSLISSLSVLAIIGCGGGGGGGAGSDEDVKVENRDIFNIFGNGVGLDSNTTAIFNSENISNLPAITYQINSLVANACEGTAVYTPSSFTLDSNTSQSVAFNVTFGDFEKCITNKITFNYSIVTDGGNINYAKTITNPTYDQGSVYRENGTDPLFQYQWHLVNTGQSYGVSTPAVAGNDINVKSVWDSGLTGKGVTVAVIDSGVDMFHPDLVPNLKMDLSHNYHTGKYISEGGINNTTPVRYEVTMTNPDSGNEITGGYYDYRHGTAVAGLIAAKGWNGIGTRGVAPDAGLVSYNSLEIYGNEDETESAKLFKAHKIPYLYSNAELMLKRLVNALTGNIDKVDIYNNSWGSSIQTLNYGIKDLNFEDTLKYGVVQGRDRKGAIYVKSAGNEGGEGGWNNFEPMQTNPYMIVVGSSGADGEAATYTTSGPNTLVNAPGGGAQSEFVKPDLHEVVTTDMAGLKRGYDSNIPYLSDTQHFNVKGNENYDYTQLMNGTSAAAPIVSGVVALMLEANPNLTWRDVKYILAHTADKTGTAGWEKNGANLWYSNALGFGRVNAQNAVNMAKGFTSLGGLASMSEVKDNGVGGESENGVISSTIDIDEDITIEHVKVNLSMDLNASTVYKTYKFSGSSSTTTAGFQLYPGDSLITVSSTFASPPEGNSTVTNVKLIKNVVVADDDSAEDIASLTFEEQGTVKKKVTVKESAEYKLLVDSNTTSWHIEVVTPMPHTQAKNLNITLTSPDGTESLLVRAPNGLSTSETYTDATLSSVEFMDEDSKGKWNLKIQDINWTSDKDMTYELKGWSIDIVGR